MLSREDYMMIRERKSEGVYNKDIARELGVHPKTISRALARGSAPTRRRPGLQPSKLDPYKAQVDDLLDRGVWNAAVILRRIRAAGYTGGYTILRDYIQPKRVLRPTGVVRYETAPGEQMQHDWGQCQLRIGGVATTVHLAVNLLGYGRAVHVVAMASEDAEHTYEAIVQAFEYFGGACATVLVDNQKAAVLDWREGGPRFNPRFRALGQHYGFTPKACRPRRAQTKGKVERMVRYVKDNALAGSPAFDSFAELNAYLAHWCDHVANTRMHGELKHSVAERWQAEQPHLLALPGQRFDTAYHGSRQVSPDAYIRWAGRRYSVPGQLAGETVAVRVTLDGWLAVRHADLPDPAALHRLAPQAHATVTVAAHHVPLWADVRVAERDLATYLPDSPLTTDSPAAMELR